MESPTLSEETLPPCHSRAQGPVHTVELRGSSSEIRGKGANLDIGVQAQLLNDH